MGRPAWLREHAGEKPVFLLRTLAETIGGANGDANKIIHYFVHGRSYFPFYKMYVFPVVYAERFGKSKSIL